MYIKIYDSNKQIKLHLNKHPTQKSIWTNEKKSGNGDGNR